MNFSLVRAKQARVTDVALIHRKGCSARRENHISDVSVIAFISAARDWQRRHNQFFRRVQGNIATRCKIDFLTPDSTTRPVAISRLDLFKMFDYSWITATQLIPRLYIYEIRFPFASTFFSLLLLVFDALEIQLVLVVGSRNKVVGFKARCIISWLIKGGEIVRQRIKFVSPFSVFEVIFTWIRICIGGF